VKTLAVLGAAILLTGCNAPPVQEHTSSAHTPALFQRADGDPAQVATASALAFDPPLIANEPAIDLSREGRQPVAVLGYEDTVTTFSYTRSDDWFGFDLNNGLHFQRRAVSERVGVSYR
jgi:hypothetical protein